jgi:hypothetical protein
VAELKRETAACTEGRRGALEGKEVTALSARYGSEGCAHQEGMRRSAADGAVGSGNETRCGHWMPAESSGWASPARRCGIRDGNGSSECSAAASMYTNGCGGGAAMLAPRFSCGDGESSARDAGFGGERGKKGMARR